MTNSVAKTKVYSTTLYLLAVDQKNVGRVIPVEMSIYYPGSGDIVVNTSGGSIANDTFISIKYSLILGSILTGIDYRIYDFIYDFPPGLEVEGPSATLAFLLGVLGFYRNITISRDVGVTGLVSPIGIVGEVGGTVEKYETGLNYGLDLVIGPYDKQLMSATKYAPVSSVFNAFERYSGVSIYQSYLKYSGKYLETIYMFEKKVFKDSYEYFKNLVEDLLRKAGDNYLLNNTIGYRYYLLANKYGEKGSWYTASSYMFRSYISLEDTYLNQLYRSSRSVFERELGDLTNATGLMINMFEDIIDKAMDNATNIWRLDALINAYERYYVAKQLYESINTADNVSTSIDNVVTSFARINTAFHWLGLINNSFNTITLDDDDFRIADEMLKQYLLITIDYLHSLNIISNADSSKEIINSVEGSPLMMFINHTIFFIELNTRLHSLIKLFDTTWDDSFIDFTNKTLYNISTKIYLIDKTTPPSLHYIGELLNNYVAENENRTVTYTLLINQLSRTIPLIILINTKQFKYIETSLSNTPVSIKAPSSPLEVEIVIGILVIAIGSFLVGYVFGTRKVFRSSRGESYDQYPHVVFYESLYQ